MSPDSLLPLLRNRRSIRKFLPRPVEPEKVELLLEAVLRAPSSRGRQPWDFIVVTDPARLHKLAEARPQGSTFLAGAPLAVVVTANPEKCDVWIEDCSIASILLQLAASSLGLGSCWVQVRMREHGDGNSAEAYLRDQLQLPAGQVVECMVGIGYPDEEKPGHGKDSLPWEKLHGETFGSPMKP